MNAMTTQDLSGYESWLKAEGYQPTTIRASLYALKRRVVRETSTVLESDKICLRRYLLFTQVTGEHPLGPGFSEALVGEGLRAAQLKAKGGHRKRAALDRGKLGKLLNALQEGGDDSQLLAIYASSSLRINDFLSQRCEDVVSPALQTWLENRPKREFVYETVSPSLSWARRRLLRKLRTEASKLDINADLDTLWRSRWSFV